MQVKSLNRMSRGEAIRELAILNMFLMKKNVSVSMINRAYLLCKRFGLGYFDRGAV